MKFNDKKISVVVPVYNVGKYLKRCIDSILFQTYGNLEIILVNDGSTDNSKAICESYLKLDKRIKLLNKENAGLGMARNTGIEHATGDIILFIDGDDYIADDMIESLYSDMLENEADTCVGSFTRSYENRIEPQPNPSAPKLFVDKEVRQELLVRMIGKGKVDDYIEMSACKVLFSMDIIRKFNIQFKSERIFISEDLIFGTDYYSHASRVFLSENVGYFYCFNEGSLTTKYRPDRFKKQKELYLEMVERTKKLGIYEEAKYRNMAMFASISRYCLKVEQKFSIPNGKKNALKNMNEICSDSLLQDVINQYNHFEPSYKSRLINFLIVKKCVRVLYYIMKLKNKFDI